jgi:hypothetical protein
MKEAAKTVKSSVARSAATSAGYLMSLCERREAASRAPFTERVDVLLEDLSSGNAEIVPEDFCDDPTIPPPGRRSGSGSSTILPYLVRTLAAKPRDPADHEPAVNDAPPLASGAGTAPRSARE